MLIAHIAMSGSINMGVVILMCWEEESRRQSKEFEEDELQAFLDENGGQTQTILQNNWMLTSAHCNTPQGVRKGFKHWEKGRPEFTERQIETKKLLANFCSVCLKASLSSHLIFKANEKYTMRK